MSESGSSGYRTTSCDDLHVGHVGQIPFSPTSPGKRSPGRPRTMKEYEEDLASLKKENFNLKVRIYFLEQHRVDPSLPKDVDELRHMYTNLKVEYDLQKKDLETKENLLLDTYKALDVQKQQLEAVTEEREELRCRIENLEKLRELQDCLTKEKERVLMLEEEISVLNERYDSDHKSVQKLVSQLQDTEEKLKTILGERNRYEDLYSNASTITTRLEKSLKRRMDVLKERDAETEKWKSLAEELRKQLTRVENQLQEEQERNSTSQSEKQMKILYSENEKLKHEVKYLQQLAEKRSSKGGLDRDQEQKEVRRRQAELVCEVEALKARLAQSKGFIQTMVKEKKQLQAQLDKLKRTVRSLSGTSTDAAKEESLWSPLLNYFYSQSHSLHLGRCHRLSVVLKGQSDKSELDEGAYPPSSGANVNKTVEF